MNNGVKDGEYTLVHRTAVTLPGEEVGSFKVKHGVLSERTGMAANILQDGAVTPATAFQIKRINNGYIEVQYRR